MITASIVTYKTDPEQLRTVIACTADSAVDRIYVVDNSPEPTLGDFAQALSTKVEYIHGQGNVGYGTAHNIAIRRAMAVEAEYHIVLNPDIQFNPDDIRKMADYMSCHSDVGWLMPRVVYPD